MRDDFDEVDELLAGRPEYPKTVQTAGVIWIIFGLLDSVIALINLLLPFGKPAGGGAFATGQLCGKIMIMVFGAAFLLAGIQSTKGTAKDTLGNGIGSIVFALLIGGSGAMLMVGAFIAEAEDKAAALIVGIVGGVNLLSGVGLLAAGVLALIGREDYKAWRRMHKSRKGRSRD